ncbi:MAG: hypothetical protein MHM6MM_000433 [Cercozoa sp. M6MM]
MGFEAPEVWQWPPFFTLQPVAATRQKQLALWAQVLCDYLKAEHPEGTVINVTGAVSQIPFKNESLSRGLGAAGVRAVLDTLVEMGHAKWQDEKENCLATHRTFGDWATLLCRWATSENHINDMLTLFEVRKGDLSVGQEFHGVSASVMFETLSRLAETGQVALYEGAERDEYGVKFLPAAGSYSSAH